MSTQQEKLYLRTLLAQGQENLNICPTCFRRGERNPGCTNLVVLMPEKVLVCCCLGNKHEVTEEEFEAQVAYVKAQQK